MIYDAVEITFIIIIIVIIIPISTHEKNVYTKWMNKQEWLICWRHSNTVESSGGVRANEWMSEQTRVADKDLFKTSGPRWTSVRSEWMNEWVNEQEWLTKTCWRHSDRGRRQQGQNEWMNRSGWRHSDHGGQQGGQNKWMNEWMNRSGKQRPVEDVKAALESREVRANEKMNEQEWSTETC